jgi:hypothetical protein
MELYDKITGDSYRMEYKMRRKIHVPKEGERKRKRFGDKVLLNQVLLKK